MVHRPHAHVVFTPRHRHKAFTDEIPRRCEDIMIEACDGFGATPAELNGEHDHVHLLVHHPPKMALTTPVGSLKGVSARMLRKEFRPASAGICGAALSGPPRMSPRPAAEHSCRSSRSTSRTSNGQAAPPTKTDRQSTARA